MALPAPKPSIDTCNACGKLFPRVSLRLCTKCAPVEEHRFELVRDYLLDNNGAAVGEISRGTGVSAADVHHFLDGGRLVQIRAGLDGCSCSGAGERCRYCRAQLTSTFRDMESTMKRDVASRGTPGGAAGNSDGTASGRTSYVRRIRRVGE